MIRGEDIVAEARSWLGTPFHHQGRVKGAGVDCVGVPLLAARACGCQVQDRSGYSRLPDGETLESELVRQMVQVAAPEPGDVLLFKMPRLPRHVGLYAGVVDGEPRFIHATSDAGRVVEVNLDGVWRRALKQVYRFREVAGLMDSAEGA